MNSIKLCILLVCLGLANASPMLKKLEKKSISDSLAPKAIEPVKQSLDDTHIDLEAPAGEKLGRAKKQTTLCVQFHAGKPSKVDCDEHNNGPLEPVEPSVPAEPAPQPEPVPEPQPQPQPQPALFHYGADGTKYEPEIGAFYIPSQETVYVPTGNCKQQSGALAPAVVPAAQPGIQFLHIPSAVPASSVPASSLSGLHGLHGLHGFPHLHGLHSLHGLDSHGSNGNNFVYVPVPHAVSYGALHGLQKPTFYQTVPGHGVYVPNHHHQCGLQCHCKSSQVSGQRSADGSNAPSMMTQPETNAAVSSMMAQANPMSALPESIARYLPVKSPSMPYQQPMMYPSGSGMYPMMNPMVMGGYYRASNPLEALENSFQNTQNQINQGLRLSRGPDEKDAKELEEQQKQRHQIEADEATTGEMMKSDDTNSRIARFLMPEKDEVENRLDDNVRDV